MQNTIKVQLKRSGAGRIPKHKKTLIGLGLMHVGQVRELKDSPQVRGMIDRVSYLVRVLGEGAKK